MDAWFIFGLTIIGYIDISYKLKKILNNQNKDNKKDYSEFEKLKGGIVELESNDEDIFDFGVNPRGILKDFNDTWIILENDKELNYYRINSIKGMLEVK